MKKLLLLIPAFCLFSNSFAAFEVKPAKKATEIFLFVGSGQKISLKEFSTISLKNYELLSGKHLNFFERLTFKTYQKQVKRGINPDNTINSPQLMKFVNGDGDNSTGIHFGGLALGFFLIIIGVIIAYVSGGDEDVKKNRIQWAWIGSGISIAIVAALLGYR